MKIIRTSKETDQVINDLNLIMNNDSFFVLVEDGFETVPGLINIVFKDYNTSLIRDLLMKAGYYSSNSNHILGKINDELELIKLKDIVYFEGVNNDTYVKTSTNEYITKLKLCEIEELYHTKLLVRISKSFIVSLHHIKKIKPTFNGKLILVLDNGDSLEVTRHYIKNFRNMLGM